MKLIGVLLFVMPCLGWGDSFTVSVDFASNLLTPSTSGIGSFSTNGVCGICIAGDGLSNFTFTAIGKIITESDAEAAQLTYLRATNLFVNNSVVHDGDLGLLFVDRPQGLQGIAISDPSLAPSGFELGDGNIAAASTPEPNTYLLIVSGLLFSGNLKRRKAK